MQRRRHPAPIEQQRHIAARAFGDLALGIPQHGVKHAGGHRGECVVVGTARGLAAHEFAVRLVQRAPGQLQPHALRRHLHGKRLGPRLPLGIEQQPRTPQALRMGLLQLAQALLHLRCIPRVAKMRCGRRHALQMSGRMAQVTALQRQGFQQFKRLAGALHKGALVLPLQPLGHLAIDGECSRPFPFRLALLDPDFSGRQVYLGPLEFTQLPKAVAAVVSNNQKTFQVLGQGSQQYPILTILDKALARVVLIELDDVRYAPY